MNSKQTVKLKMYIAVRDFLTKFLTTVSVLPNFNTYFTALKNAITQIQNSGEQQGFDKTGSTASKNDLKKNLAKLAADTARKIVAYAKATGNVVLEKEIDFTESDLKKMTDSKLRDIAKGIYDRAQENLTELEPYFVTAATQTALLAAINSFEKSMGDPRLVTAETSQTTYQMAQGFKDADKALDDLDTLIEVIRLTQVDFYVGFKSVRKQVNNTGSPTAIKGTVRDAAGNPLRGVTVTITSLPGSANPVKIVKKTAKKGGFRVSNIPEGTYNVVATLPGFKDYTTRVNVISGQRSTLDIIMEKI